MAKPDLDTLVLAKGAHAKRSEGVCLLEAVAWFAGKEHTDHPPCVSPMLGTFGRAWNDVLSDEERQKLLPLIPIMVGTAGSADDELRRAWMAWDWLIREYTPAWLDAAGLHRHAIDLRALREIISIEHLRLARSSIDAARDATWAAARDAAWAAAGDAAWATLRPVVVQLQESAIELVKRLCAVGREP